MCFPGPVGKMGRQDWSHEVCMATECAFVTYFAQKRNLCAFSQYLNHCSDPGSIIPSGGVEHEENSETPLFDNPSRIQYRMTRLEAEIVRCEHDSRTQGSFWIPPDRRSIILHIPQSMATYHPISSDPVNPQMDCPNTSVGQCSLEQS